MRTRVKVCVACLLAIILIGILISSPALSSLVRIVTIPSNGNISGNVTAASGSSQDIQTAVNLLSSAGGGTVYVPSGNFTFNIDFTTLRVDNGYAGVQIPGGINVIGAGNNQTILCCPLTGWHYSDQTSGQSLFILNGANGKPIRISGIYFQGSNNFATGADDDRALNAISEYCVTDFRIDHNTFIDFNNHAIEAWLNLGWVNNPNGNKGVIDHNIIDNPYKDTFYTLTGTVPIWGYGIGVTGYSEWKTLSQVLGQYGADTVYIENNSFRRCRHDIASSSGAWYVARYNTFFDNIKEGYGAFVDVHGSGRGCEVYNNTFIDVAEDYRSTNQPQYWGTYNNLGVGLRGGAAVIFNNTIINCFVGVNLANDQGGNSEWRINQVWVWSNTYTDVANSYVNYSDYYPVRQDIEFFLRAPTQGQDGFVYTPYPYPHPLTLKATP